MNAIEIVVIVVASLIVVFTIGYNIWARKKGKTCCGDCANCSACSKGKKDDKSVECSACSKGKKYDKSTESSACSKGKKDIDKIESDERECM